MHAMHLCMTEQRLRRRPTICGSTRAMAFIRHCERAPCPLAARVRETATTRPLFGLRPRSISWRYGLLRFANKKQRAQRSGKPVLSYPRKRVSSGTRRGDARLAPGGSSKPPKFCQRRGILDAHVRGHDTRERPIQAPVGLVQGGPAAGRYELAMTERARANGNSQSTSPRQAALSIFWAPP